MSIRFPVRSIPLLMVVLLAGCSEHSGGFTARGAVQRTVLTEDLAALDDGGQPILARPERLSVDPQGRFVVSDYSDKNIKIYDRTGKRVATLGGPGRGPGEFSTLLTAQVYRDSLVAYDFVGARLSVFAPDGRYVRALSLSKLPFAPWSIRVVDDSLFLAVAAVPGSGKNAPLLAMLRSDGTPISTFFTPAGSVGDNPEVVQNVFVLADAAQGVVYAALAGGDSLWTFDYRGRSLGSGVVDPDHPLPSTRALAEANGGRLRRPDGSNVLDGKPTLVSVVALDSGSVAMQVMARDVKNGTDLLEGGTLVVAAAQPNAAPVLVARTEVAGALAGRDRNGAPLVLRYASTEQDRYAVTRLRLSAAAQARAP